MTRKSKRTNGVTVPDVRTIKEDAQIQSVGFEEEPELTKTGKVKADRRVGLYAMIPSKLKAEMDEFSKANGLSKAKIIEAGFRMYKDASWDMR